MVRAKTLVNREWEEIDIEDEIWPGDLPRENIPEFWDFYNGTFPPVKAPGDSGNQGAENL